MAEITLSHHGDSKIVVMVRPTKLEKWHELLKLSVAESMQLASMLASYASHLQSETVRVELPEKVFELKAKGGA